MPDNKKNKVSDGYTAIPMPNKLRVRYIASFSPASKGDGMPMTLFDRLTGKISTTHIQYEYAVAIGAGKGVGGLGICKAKTIETRKLFRFIRDNINEEEKGKILCIVLSKKIRILDTPGNIMLDTVRANYFSNTIAMATVLRLFGAIVKPITAREFDLMVYKDTLKPLTAEMRHEAEKMLSLQRFPELKGKTYINNTRIDHRGLALVMYGERLINQTRNKLY